MLNTNRHFPKPKPKPKPKEIRSGVAFGFGFGRAHGLTTGIPEPVLQPEPGKKADEPREQDNYTRRRNRRGGGYTCNQEWLSFFCEVEVFISGGKDGGR